jgi:hypothetical protein
VLILPRGTIDDHGGSAAMIVDRPTIAPLQLQSASFWWKFWRFWLLVALAAQYVILPTCHWYRVS